MCTMFPRSPARSLAQRAHPAEVAAAETHLADQQAAAPAKTKKHLAAQQIAEELTRQRKNGEDDERGVGVGVELRGSRSKTVGGIAEAEDGTAPSTAKISRLQSMLTPSNNGGGKRDNAAATQPAVGGDSGSPPKSPPGGKGIKKA